MTVGGAVAPCGGFPAGEGAWDGGDRGGEKAALTVGQDPGRMESRGWLRAFTLRLHFHPPPEAAGRAAMPPALLARII